MQLTEFCTVKSVSSNVAYKNFFKITDLDYGMLFKLIFYIAINMLLKERV